MANPAPKPNPRTVAAVALGGVVGALARVYLPWPSLTFPGDPGDPLPTLVVNMLGSVLLGLIAGYATHRKWPEPLHKGITVGVLGSFSTMSALALAVSLAAAGQTSFGIASSVPSPWLWLLAILMLVGFLGLTTLLTLASYRVGLRRAAR
ncbi:FluC/FEX family fluoride channel [Enteractinococcus coprophilus]|uniref:Fluoride-specific ion channel n=1 Tax=Enteractinococcus coprophilus TaxID=1027633 RepID=A0A542ZZV6_9MICC|nr:CrcB family protein [Enteractinococcus coprophilus]TQL65872.1 camphor resistance protein CrcB [Enteractinococcus coprophilus]